MSLVEGCGVDGQGGMRRVRLGFIIYIYFFSIYSARGDGLV